MNDLRFAFWIPTARRASDLDRPTTTAADRFVQTQWFVQLAEDHGFDHAFAPARGLAAASPQLDALALVAAIAAVTRRIGLVAALRPYLRHPRLTAKTIHSIDIISSGRTSVNVVATVLKEDFTSYGELLDHDEQYRRAEDFIRALRDVWIEENTAIGLPARIEPPTPNLGGRRHPHLPIFQSGNSHAARALAGKLADWYLMDGDKPEALSRQIDEVRGFAYEAGRDPDAIRFGVNALVVQRDSEREAQRDLRAAFGWPGGAGGNLEEFDDALADRAQGNDGFKTGLIGTEEQILDRIGTLRRAGISLLLCSFLDHRRDLPKFGDRIIQSVRGADMPLPRSIDPAIRQALGLGG